MEPHCALGKAKNLLVHVHNKIHQSNLNSFYKGFILYLPMQKREKMEPRTSSEVT